MRETLACVPQTVQRATAVLVTSGRRSASQCCAKVKCAPNNARKAHTAWRSFSAATVPKAWRAKCGRTLRPTPGPDCTCASRPERSKEVASNEGTAAEGFMFPLGSEVKRTSSSQDSEICEGESWISEKRLQWDREMNLGQCLCVCVFVCMCAHVCWLVMDEWRLLSMIEVHDPI